MLPKLKQYLNRSILVSIPTLFEDGICRAHTLQSIEADGLWLRSNELTARLLPEPDRKIAGSSQPVFVPAAQIAAIILPSTSASTARLGDAAATPAGDSTTETAAAAKAGAPRRTKAVAAAEAAPPQDTTATRQK
jgi:hypothetical protein